uniref:Uncharacterized protein n=1 Tax=Glycine max TaxID=3847 RepID=C6SZD7_SOYBN|nr:unknown [Glycine max]
MAINKFDFSHPCEDSIIPAISTVASPWSHYYILLPTFSFLQKIYYPIGLTMKKHI